MNAQDADEAIINSSGKVSEFMTEFRKKWAQPYTAIAQKQQAQAMQSLAPQMKENMRAQYMQMLQAKPDFRDQLIQRVGEDKVLKFEALIEVE
jgi:hypothetical protein